MRKMMSRSERTSANQDAFEKRAKDLHGGRYRYNLAEYVTRAAKISIECTKCGRSFRQSPASHLQGRGCPMCAWDTKRTPGALFVEKARKIHGSKYEYRAPYVGGHTPIEIWCNTCETSFTQSPSGHLQGRGCETCSYKERGAKRAEKVASHFEVRARKVHGDLYRYPEAYVKSNEKITIYCIACDAPFEQLPSHHLRGHGCRKCSAKRAADLYRRDVDTFICEAVAKHRGRYIYSDDYVNSHTKIGIMCQECGNIFEQVPSSHLAGYGCPICSRKKRDRAACKTAAVFEEAAAKKHPGLYRYFSDYVHSEQPVTIWCLTCAKPFRRTPRKHLGGAGCRSCLRFKRIYEEHAKAFFDAHALAYIHNHKIDTDGGRRFVDFFFPYHQVFVEIDEAYHGRPIQKELDQTRQDEIEKLTGLPFIRLPALSKEGLDVALQGLVALFR